MEQIELIVNDKENAKKNEEMPIAVDGIEKKKVEGKIDDDVGKENKVEEINGKLNINASEFVPRLKHNKDGKPELNLIELQRHFESMDAMYRNEAPIIKSVEALERALIEQTIAENKRKLEAQWINFPKGLTGLSENANNAAKGTRIVMLNENDYFVTPRLKRPKRDRSEPAREKPWDPELKSMYGKRFETDEKRREHERKVALDALKLVEQRRARALDKQQEAVGSGDDNDVSQVRHISYSPLRMGAEDSDRVQRLRNAKKQRIERVLREMENKEANTLASKKKSEDPNQENKVTIIDAMVSTHSINVKPKVGKDNKDTILKESNRNDILKKVANDPKDYPSFKKLEGFKQNGGVSSHFKTYIPKSINMRNKPDLGHNSMHPLQIHNDGYRKKPYGSHNILRSDIPPYHDDEKENFYQPAYGGGPSNQHEFRRNIYGRSPGYPNNNKYLASNAFRQNNYGDQGNYIHSYKNYDMPDGMLPPTPNYYKRESGFPYSRSPFTNMRYRGGMRTPNNTPVHHNPKYQHQLRSNSPTAAFFKADNKPKATHQHYGRHIYSNNRYLDNNAESGAAAVQDCKPIMPFNRTGPKRTYDMKKMIEIKHEVIKTYAQVAGGVNNGHGKEVTSSNGLKLVNAKTDDASKPSAGPLINDTNDFPALKPKYVHQQQRDQASKKPQGAIKRYTIEDLMMLASPDYQLTLAQCKNLSKLETIRKLKSE